MWQISKTFDFCYGHRVWSQELNAEFSDNSCCSCRHLHGHNANVSITLYAKELNKIGMVTDFKHLGWFKKWLKDCVDHKFIVDKNDPLLKTLIHDSKLKNLYFEDKNIAQIIDIDENLDGALKEYYESFVIVDFIPTSENLSKWICDIASYKMNKINVNVLSVEFFETEKSKSIYLNS